MSKTEQVLFKLKDTVFFMKNNSVFKAYVIEYSVRLSGQRDKLVARIDGEGSSYEDFDFFADSCFETKQSLLESL